MQARFGRGKRAKGKDAALKITALKTFLVQPRWLFLRVETDEGVAGWGEPVLEGRAETLAALIGELSDFLIDRDPRRINDIWQMLYRNGCYRGGPVQMRAIAGVDMALWDVLGKVKARRLKRCSAARSANASRPISGSAATPPIAACLQIDALVSQRGASRTKPRPSPQFRARIARFGHRWPALVWRHEDGSIAERDGRFRSAKEARSHSVTNWSRKRLSCRGIAFGFF
jgi:L-alanine-DL-glutamate epimerase-like enolase superfamily enzyme